MDTDCDAKTIMMLTADRFGTLTLLAVLSLRLPMVLSPTFLPRRHAREEALRVLSCNQKWHAGLGTRLHVSEFHLLSTGALS